MDISNKIKKFAVTDIVLVSMYEYFINNDTI